MELNRYADPKLNAQAVLVSPAWDEYLARFVSGLSTPPLVATLGIVISARTVEQSSVWLWVLIYTLFSIIAPTLYVLWLVRRGSVTNFHLNIREQRKRPLLIILAGATLAWGLLIVGGAPILLLVLTGAGIIQVLLIFLITLRWKISGHSAAVSGVAVLALMLFGKVAVFLALTVPIVAWSRISLGRHSLYQTVAGAFLGGLIIAVALLLYQKWIMTPEL